MKRKEVKSSNIKSIGYDDKAHTLEIEFINGGVYHYHPISDEGYQALMASESKGSYFFKNIRNNEGITVTKI